jgi:hypothetical protein
MKLLHTVFYIAATCGLGVATGCGTSIATIAPGSSCSAGSSSGPNITCPARVAVAGASFDGKVVADLKPVMGASVQLYAAGSTGNGSAPVALLAQTLTTNSAGAFAVSAGYSCPSAQTPLYVLSKGGKPGGAANNSSLWLMAALGPCSSIVAGSSFVLNEVTTVAAASALAPFMSSGGNVGATCTNTAGLDNAFQNAKNLVNAATGYSPGSGIPSTLAIPTAKLDTLSNALTTCSGTGACSSLFSAATSDGAVPANTLDAALNIVHSPANNLAAVYALASANSAFSPALATAPPDWMLTNTVRGGGMSLPSSLSITASGNVWVASYLNTVSEFTASGAAVFPTGISGHGINQSYGLALDIQGNVWIANEQTTSNSGLGSITELNASGQLIASGITNGGIDFPVAATADSNGNMWIVDYGDSKVTLLNNSATPLSGTTGWGETSLQFPVALAVDSKHNAWVANQAGILPVTKISSDGSQITNFKCDCNGASGIATDQNDNVWVANYTSSTVSQLNTCGDLVLDAVSGGGLQQPQGIAIDGAGTAWITNFHGNSLTQIAGAASASHGTFLSPTTGFGADAALLNPFAVAIDSSGSIWVSNAGNNTLTQFIGIASPVRTPLAGPPQLP